MAALLPITCALCTWMFWKKSWHMCSSSASHPGEKYRHSQTPWRQKSRLDCVVSQVLISERSLRVELFDPKSFVRESYRVHANVCQTWGVDGSGQDENTQRRCPHHSTLPYCADSIVLKQICLRVLSAPCGVLAWQLHFQVHHAVPRVGAENAVDQARVHTPWVYTT